MNYNEFWLRMSFALDMEVRLAKHHIKEMHERLISNKAELKDFSEELQRCYSRYLTFLKIQKHEKHVK